MTKSILFLTLFIVQSLFGAITEVGIEHFDDFTRQNNHLLVQFFEPWCQSCKDFEVPIQRVVEKLQHLVSSNDEGEIVAIKINTNGNSDIMKLFRITHYPHIVYYYKGHPIKYKERNGEEELSIWLSTRLKREPHQIRKDNLVKELQYKIGIPDQQIRYIYLGGKTGQDYDVIQALVKSIQSDMKIFFLEESEVNHFNEITGKQLSKESFVRLNLKTMNVKQYRGDLTLVGLHKFLTTSSLSFPEIFSQNLFSELILEKIPIIWIFVKKFSDRSGEDVLKPIFSSHIMSNAAVIKFTNPNDQNQELYAKYWDIKRHETVSLCIIDTKNEMKRYLFQNAFNPENVKSFIYSYFNNTLIPYIRIETLLRVHENEVENLNTFSLEQMMKRDIHLHKVVLFYSFRNEVWRTVMDHFQELAEEFKGKMAQFGRINVDLNEIPDLNDMDVPAIAILKGSGDLYSVDYEGRWTKEDMREFLYYHISSNLIDTPSSLIKGLEGLSLDDDQNEEEEEYVMINSGGEYIFSGTEDEVIPPTNIVSQNDTILNSSNNFPDDISDNPNETDL